MRFSRNVRQKPVSLHPQWIHKDSYYTFQARGLSTELRCEAAITFDQSRRALRCGLIKGMVGVRGFEPPASSSRTRRAKPSCATPRPIKKKGTDTSPFVSVPLFSGILYEDAASCQPNVRE